MRAWILVAVCGFGVGVATPVYAEGPSPASEAEALFVEGIRAFKGGDYELAREKFERSCQLRPRGSALYNLSFAEKALGRKVDAVKHLRAALHQSDLEGPARERAQHDFDEVYAQTGHIAVTTEEGAKVKVDGAERDGVAPFADELDVTAGRHALEARLGARLGKTEVEAPAGTSVRAQIVLSAPEPVTAAVPPSSRTLPPEVAAGSTVSSSSWPPAESPTPRSAWGPGQIAGVSISAGGVVLLGVGAYFYAEGGDALSRARARVGGSGGSDSACSGGSQAGQCQTLADSISTERRDATFERLFLGIGAAAAVGGAVVYFAWPRSRGGNFGLLPLVLPGVAGIQVRGGL